MHVGALVGFTRDNAERAALLARIKHTDMGFMEQPDGAWSWHFAQLPLMSDLGEIPGNMTVLARVIGVPFARLRCALPEELFGGVTAQLVGRRSGLSTTTRSERLAAVSICTPHDDKNGTAAADDPQSKPLFRRSFSAKASSNGDIEMVSSTALMFAVCSMRCLVPEYEVRPLLPADALVARACFAAYASPRLCVLCGLSSRSGTMLQPRALQSMAWIRMGASSTC
jgi:hypothetical protein